MMGMVGRGGIEGFQLFMLSSNLLKFEVPLWFGVGVGVVERIIYYQFPTFDAESKFAQIPKSHYGGG